MTQHTGILPRILVLYLKVKILSKKQPSSQHKGSWPCQDNSSTCRSLNSLKMFEAFSLGDIQFKKKSKINKMTLDCVKCHRNNKCRIVQVTRKRSF